MASISLLFSLMLTSLLTSPYMPVASASFIRMSCSRTLYRDLCYSSLSPYAGQVGSNPVLLARYAMNVTLGSLKPLHDRIADLRHHKALVPSSDAAALKDCSGLISNAMDLVRRSEKEVTGLEAMVGPQVMWRIGNAQTWLSAAETDESTCTNGFKEQSGGTGDDIEEEIGEKVNTAKQLTSNALALVNGLVRSH